MATASDCRTPSMPRTTKYEKLVNTKRTVIAETLMTIDSGRFLHGVHISQQTTWAPLIFGRFVETIGLFELRRPSLSETYTNCCGSRLRVVNQNVHMRNVSKSAKLSQFIDSDLRTDIFLDLSVLIFVNRQMTKGNIRKMFLLVKYNKKLIRR